MGVGGHAVAASGKARPAPLEGRARRGGGVGGGGGGNNMSDFNVALSLPFPCNRLGEATFANAILHT